MVRGYLLVFAVLKISQSPGLASFYLFFTSLFRGGCFMFGFVVFTSSSCGDARILLSGR